MFSPLSNAIAKAVASSVVAAPMSVASSEALLPSMLVPSTLRKSLSTTFAFATKTLPFDIPVDNVAVVTACH